MPLPHLVKTATLSPPYGDRHFEAELLSLIPNLRAFSNHLCGWNLGEDLTQETLIKAWRARSSYRSEGNMKAWLFRILRNEYLSHNRRAWRQVAWDENKGGLIEALPLQQWVSKVSEMQRALLLLPANQRDALLLVGSGESTYEQAAAITAVAVGTMKSRVSRARARLVDLVGGIDAAP